MGLFDQSFNNRSAAIIASGSTQFGNSQTESIALLKVEEAFNGVNYMEALATNNKESLAYALGTEDEKRSAGSLSTSDTDSIFNKFSIFKYSKFINGSVYQPDAHFIGYAARDKADPYTENQNNRINQSISDLIDQDRNLQIIATQEGANDNANSIKNRIDNNVRLRDLYKRSASNYSIMNASSLANPTASNIIKWASTQSMESVTGFQPYAMTDFMFCKNYGKIPNNRLITLRRYPFPMEDLLRAPGNKNPIPIAQAVTWFGEGTDNLLSNMGYMNWGLRWENLPPIDAPQIIEGNEVTVTDLIKIFKGIDSLKELGGKIEAVYVGLNGKDSQLQQLTGMEKKFQDYARSLYESNGPYWNRVYGPVNVINTSTRRAKGMQDGWSTPFTVNFHYSFRSFNGLSPKIVALDLLGSFLNLTYNDAQFLGQLARYFPRLGVKFDETMTQVMGRILTEWGTNFQGDINSIMAQLAPLFEGIQQATGESIKNMGQIFSPGSNGLGTVNSAVSNIVQAGSASLLANAIPNLISVKSALSDRPIGEWHMVVGNPMNPIMVMGDLVVSNCILKWDEELGPDDFPTGCTFSVKLQQGKPRDKAAIERMFNLGSEKLLYHKMRNPSSANDTYGETSNSQFQKLTATTINGEKNPDALTDTEKQEISKQLGTGSFDRYRNRIRRSYGYAPSTFVDVKDNTPERMDDSLLWLYFDKSQEKM